jgi:hypothetical protein
VRLARALCAALALFALPAPAAEPFSRGLLWRVSKPGVEASHVYGTIHVADPRLADLPEPVRAALAGARALMLEYVADAYGKERFLEAAMFLDRQTLEEKIGAEDFARVLEMLEPIGVSRGFVNKLKPWGVLLNLRAPPQDPGGVTLDGQLFDHARARRMAISQMEVVEEHVSLFDDFPMGSQVALLKHALAHREELAGMARQTLDAYLARDLAAIWRVQQDFVARHPQIAADNAALVKRVVFDRNVVLAFRMQRELRRGRAFIALGALHLYGSRGVLALLRKDGYRVSRVY